VVPTPVYFVATVGTQVILVQVIAEVVMGTEDINIRLVTAEKDKMRVCGAMFCRSAAMRQHMLPNTWMYVIHIRLCCSLIGGLTEGVRSISFATCANACIWSVGGTGWHKHGLCKV
jgi:hypothetical protein